MATVEPVGGRVGGLLRLPVAVPVRVAELAVGFVAVALGTPGRRAAVVDAAAVDVRFAVADPVAGFAAESALAALEAVATAGLAGASARLTASEFSMSDMMGYGLARNQGDWWCVAAEMIRLAQEGYQGQQGEFGRVRQDQHMCVNKAPNKPQTRDIADGTATGPDAELRGMS